MLRTEPLQPVVMRLVNDGAVVRRATDNALAIAWADQFMKTRALDFGNESSFNVSVLVVRSTNTLPDSNR